MKKKILLTISAMFVLMLGVVAFAVNQSNASSKTATDSCAMKGTHAKGADVQAKTSCCDRDDCCCKNGSCPMKSAGENASAGCCCSSGDSCPMKNKDAQAATADMKSAADAGGKSCCNGGACCKNKHS